MAGSTVSEPHRLVSGFERFAIWLSAKNFAKSPEGEFLFYFWRSSQAYVLPSRLACERLRRKIALLTSLTVLAWTTSTGGHAILTILKLLTLPLALLVPWLCVRRFPKTNAPFPPELARRTRQAVMDLSLAVGLLEVGFGYAIFSGSLTPFELNRLTFAMVILGAGMIGDGARRLLHREPLPPEVGWPD
jgi:hypothetical protein